MTQETRSQGALNDVASNIGEALADGGSARVAQRAAQGAKWGPRAVAAAATRPLPPALDALRRTIHQDMVGWCSTGLFTQQRLVRNNKGLGFRVSGYRLSISH